MITKKSKIPTEDRLREYDRAVARLKELPQEVHVHLFDINENEKTPTGKWTKTNISFEEGRKLIERGFNIGAGAKFDGICFIDIDLTDDGKFKLPEKIINELIETYDTLTIRTRSGGFHLYFINDNLTHYLSYHGGANNPKLKFDGVDCGEIRTETAYVVFPGSYVPMDSDKKGHTADATGLYTVIRDSPIRALNEHNLPKWVVVEQEAKKQRRQLSHKITHIEDSKLVDAYHKEKFVNEFGMTLEEVREKDKELDEYLHGAEHKGGKASRSEADFDVARKLDYWCFSDEDRAAILMKFRGYDKTLYRRDYVEATISKSKMSKHYNPDYGRIIDKKLTNIERDEITELPKILPIAHENSLRWLLVKAPPRLGKTHWSMEQMALNGNGVYCTNRHEIINHAINIFMRYITPGKTAVYLAGKDRCCNREGGIDCRNCHKLPKKYVPAGEDGLTLEKATRQSFELLGKHVILTPDSLMDNVDICPYYTLMIAENAADFCFTIPFFLMNTDYIRGVKRKRDMLIIDEDPVVGSFYPQGYELLSYAHRQGHAVNCSSDMESKMRITEALKKIIGEKKKKPRIDREILRMITLLEKIEVVIKTFFDNPNQDNAANLVPTLSQIDLKNEYTATDKYELRRKLTEYEKEIDSGRDRNIYDIFSPLIHVAKIPFVEVGGRSKSIHFIADREVLFYPDESYKKIILIGATESELYVREAAGEDYDKTTKIIQINKFKYSNNFLIITLISEDKKTETKMMYRLMNMLNRYNEDKDREGSPTVPHLILESSKAKQDSVRKHFKSRSLDSTDDSEIDQFFNWETGKANVYYSNSTLSRGLDIPFYDLTFADSLNFAVPYWTAMREYARQQGNVNKVIECNAIIAKIITDEVTNSVLRCSPTKDEEINPVDAPGLVSQKELDSKIIVIRGSDADKILPNLHSEIRSLEYCASKDFTDEQISQILNPAFKILVDVPKKVSRRKNLESRNIADYPMSHLPHLARVSKEFKSKNRNPTYVVEGVTVSKLDEYLKKNKLEDTRYQVACLINTDIEKIVMDSLSGTTHRRSESSLIKLVLSNAKKNSGIITAKVRETLARMSQISAIRSETKNGKKFYRIPDITIYGDVPDPKPPKSLNKTDSK
jgi:hypothetical protein